MALSTGQTRSAASLESDPIGRFAGLALLFHDRHVLCDRIAGLLSILGRSGVWAVLGEAELLEDLRKLLSTAGDLLRREHPDLFGRVHDLLQDVAWEVAEDIERDLKDKAERDRKLGDELAEDLAGWRDEVNSLMTNIREARAAQAPVRREEAAVRRLDGLVTQLDRMLKERNLTEAYRRLQELDSSDGKDIPTEQLKLEIQNRVREGRQFIRQADLMILRSPPDQSGRFNYTILLHTPNEPGAVGVNIQASSTLTGPDWDRLQQSMKDVTDAVNTGLVRSFQEEGGVRQMTAAHPPARSIPMVSLNELIRDIGDLLYKVVIPDQIQPYLTDDCSLTITTDDLELPWELMHMEGRPLCVRQPVARMPMGRALPRQRRSREAVGKLRFLLIHADPENTLPKAGQEIAEIKRALEEDLGDRISVETLTAAEASGAKMNEVLRGGRYDVIHYAGHAAFDKTNGELSGLLLDKKEVFFAQKIRRLVEGRPLVFLNACESGYTTREAEPQKINSHLQLPAEGLASAFVYGGAVACVGSIWPVFDGPAASFAAAFYKAVLDGHPLGEAMRRARETSLKNLPNHVTWATYVLYGDPRYRLVD